MKISEGVYFNEHTLTVGGFTDLGEFTPEAQKNQRADEALVFMIQPLRGNWVQNVAAFLSKGCAPGKALKHLVAECILLLEDCGFNVHAVTSDGASWNRSMWKSFGVNESDTSFIHPSLRKPSTKCKGRDCDGIECEGAIDEDKFENGGERRLWFVSDFSHLLKHVRNYMIEKEDTWVRARL